MLNEIYLIMSLDAEWMGQFFAALALEIDANKDEGGDVLSVFRPTFEVVTKAMTQDTKLGDPDSFLYADLLVLFTQNEPMAQVGRVGGIGCCHCEKTNWPVTTQLALRRWPNVNPYAVMPTVLYIQNAFSIWHRKSVFCIVIHKICISLVPRICILQFFGTFSSRFTWLFF